MRCNSSCLLWAKSRHETLFDHLVGRGQQLWMKLQAERFGCLEVDHEVKFDGLNHWEIAWFFALEDSPGIETGLAKGIGKTRAVPHQTASLDRFAVRVQRWNRILDQKRTLDPIYSTEAEAIVVGI
jgi:hypothetical protein